MPRTLAQRIAHADTCAHGRGCAGGEAAAGFGYGLNPAFICKKTPSVSRAFF